MGIIRVKRKIEQKFFLENGRRIFMRNNYVENFDEGMF